MLIYEKNKKLYGTFGNIDSDADQELVYRDENGEILELYAKDIYVDDKQGGIIRRSDNKKVDVYLCDIKIIPMPASFPTVPELDKKSAYLFEVVYDDVDYDYADAFFNADLTPTYNVGKKLGQCTSVWKDGKIYRNFDWYYNHDTAFALHVTAKENDARFVHGKRFSSSNVADSVPYLTTDFVAEGHYSNGYRILPFYVVDGRNENGVGISMNVVPKQKGDNNRTIPAIEEKYAIQESALPRFVLDNFESAEEAVIYIKNYVAIYPNKALAQSSYDTHYIIGDKTKCFIVELIDNKVVSLEVSGNSALKPIIANFHVIRDISGAPITLDNGHVYTPATARDGKFATSQGITSHGSGLERYNLVVDNYDDLSNFRDLVLYNKAYTLTEDCWYTEFVGNYRDGFELTVDDLPEKYEGVGSDYKIMTIVRQMYKDRTRDTADTWHTTHTTVYDLETGEFSVWDSSEDNKEYKFQSK